jgi:hypothetical protein
MKPILKLVPLLLAFALSAATGLAAEIVAGPKGGRLLGAEPPRAEFFVTADRHVEITFYDASLQPVAPGEQAVQVTAEAPGDRTRLTMEKTSASFRSREPLPAGEPYRVVVQIRPTPDARPMNFRVDLNLHVCGECSRAEYACTCEGH